VLAVVVFPGGVQLLRAGLLRGGFGFARAAFAYEVGSVLVVVCAALEVGLDVEPRTLVRIVGVEGAFDCPAETTGAVLVHGFEHEEEGPDFEDGGADEGGYAAAGEDLVFEFAGGTDERKPYEAK
jgi:hypothetical protein